MRILLVDESPSRCSLLRDGLEMAGHEVVATLGSALALASCIDVLAPDVVVVDTESPTRDTLEHLVLASADTPRPIVMFSANDDTEFIRAAMRAGVTAYVASDIAPQRVRAIIDVALAQFDEFQRLRAALARAQQGLSERKTIERANGLLMRSRGLSEEDAYSLMRKGAMSRKEKIIVVAQRILEQG